MDPNPSVADDQLGHQQDGPLSDLLGRLDAAETKRSWDLVEALCRQILQFDSSNWSIWERLARAIEARGDWPQAETLWRHLTQRFHHNPEPYLALASLRRRRGAPEGARIVLEQARELIGSSPELQASLRESDDIRAGVESAPPLGTEASAGDVAAVLQEATEHLQAGRGAEAEAAYRQLVRARPGSLPFHRNLSRLRLRRGAHGQVVEQLLPLFSPLPEDGPLIEHLDFAQTLIESLVALQRWESLAPLLDGLLVHHPNHPRLLCERARTHRAHGLVGEALALLQRAMVVPAHPPAVELLFAEVMMEVGEWSSAIEALSTAVAMDPLMEKAQTRLEEARREQLWARGEEALAVADWTSAAESYRCLLDRAPDETRALGRLDLLASLEPSALRPPPQLQPGTPPGGLGKVPPEAWAIRQQRLAQFASALDRLEQGLAPHLDPLS